MDLDNLTNRIIYGDLIKHSPYNLYFDGYEKFKNKVFWKQPLYCWKFFEFIYNGQLQQPEHYSAEVIYVGIIEGDDGIKNDYYHVFYEINLSAKTVLTDLKIPDSEFQQNKFITWKKINKINFIDEDFNEVISILVKNTQG